MVRGAKSTDKALTVLEARLRVRADGLGEADVFIAVLKLMGGEAGRTVH